MSRRSNCLRLQSLALPFALLSTIAVAFFLLLRGDVTSQATSLKPDDEARRTAVKESFGRLPLYFVENRGQTDSQVAYYIKGRDKTVYFTPTGLTFALSGNGDKERHAPFAAPREAESRRYALKLDFLGAREVQPVGEERAEAIFSHFTGSKENWHSGVPSYTRVVYRELWPGIDLEYAGTVNQMKYTFHVRPWADPSQIRLAYRGASGVRVNESGELEVSTPVETFRDERPVSHQEIDGKQIEVATSFNLDQRDEESSYGFEVGEYDRSRELVIDPAVFIYAGYIGGNGGSGDDFDGGSGESANGVAVDSSGNAYVVGYTDSHESSFPVTVGPDLTYNGVKEDDYDAFVAKLNAAGTALIYCGYLGGSGGDGGSGIAVDAAGNAYLTGGTTSTEASFPVTVGPDLTYNGSGDAYVAKVNAAGTALIYCGYLGGSSSDAGSGIAVDAAGNAYLTGNTSSTEASFPETVGPDLTYNGGFYDVYVAKVNAAGTALDYCGYLGGSGYDSCSGIAVDAAGNAYLTGNTDSTEASFPETVGPDLTYNGGLYDAYVAKVNAAGTALDYCGYLGGSSYDSGRDVAVDAAGNAYLTGLTDSSEASFPETVGPDLTSNGYSDAYVAKVNAAGTALDYCGYIGGSGGEVGSGIAVDAAGNAYLTGGTTSTEASFPETVGPDLTYNGNADAYVAKVNAAGTALIYCGYIGGSSQDAGWEVAVDAQGAAYVVGGTESTETSFPDGDGFGALPGPDQTHNGFYDAFIAKVSPYPNCAEGSIAPSSASFTPEAGSGTIGVTIDPGCPWTAFSNVPWIVITSGANGTVGGTVGYSVEANYGNTTRTGTLTVAGLTFTIRQGITAVAANAASYSTVALAPDSIASIFGSNLATSEMSAETTTVPTSLAGTTVKVIDSANVERLAPLFYVSPRQINLLIPPGTAPGKARLLVTAGDGALALGETMILSVSPGLFAANADGAGAAAAYVLRVKADGTHIYEEILQLDAGLGRYVARPIDLGPEGETVFLVMHGTGVRGAAPGTVGAQIGGAEAAVSYAGPQHDYVGLDQLNLAIPRSLAGRGEVEVTIVADNQAANPLRIKVQ